MTNEKKGLRELAHGFRDRTLVTAKLATRLGMSAAKKQFGLGGSSESESDEARAIESARRLVSEMGALKGFVMKVGQMASYLPGAMPAEAQRVLSSLQAQSVAMEWDAIERVVRDEFGDTPDALFQTFDRVSVAAASIGQVHRARFQDSDVAVKVQYPGIDTLLQKDLDTIRTMSRVAFVGTRLDGVSLVDELRERMTEECDYRNEARNQEFYRSLLASDPQSHVPRTFAERTTKRVLTTEFVNGRSFYPFIEGGTQAARDAAGLTIFRTCFNSLFRHCVYNADPHPGNYLFQDDGRVTFLDFGCLRYFDANFIDRWKGFVGAYLANDRKGFRDGLVSIGLVAKPDKFDFDAHWEITRYLYRPFTTRPFTYTQEYVRESYDALLWKNPNRSVAGMTREWLFLNRLQWGLNSVLALLNATGDFGEIWFDAIHSPTEPMHP